MNPQRPLHEIISLGADDQVEIDYGVPRAPGSMGTQLRPELYVRRRRMPGTDKVVEMYFAYRRDASSSALLHALKRTRGPEMDQFIRRTAIYLAAKLPGSYDCIVPAPSSKPLAAQLALELSLRLEAPLMEPPARTGSMGKIGVRQRTAAAMDMFSMEPQPNLKGHALVVDDFTTSGATMVGIAAALLRLPKITAVTGAAIAVI